MHGNTFQTLTALVKKASPYELWPYQQKARKAVETSWQEFDRTLLIVPTAGGKTIIFADVIDRRSSVGRVLVLAHRDELIEQARDKIWRARRIVTDKEKAAALAALCSRVVVASVQTLSRSKRLERFAPDHFATIVVDEAHHALAESYQKILRYFAGAKVLGVTATPDRGDACNLGAYFQDIAYEVSLVELIKDGYLCPIKVQTVPCAIDISSVSTRAGDFSEEELGEALEPMLEEVASQVARYARGRKSLVFVPLVRIADQFALVLCRHGFAAEMISGACADRAEKLARFASGETQILVNAQLLSEGFDCPSIDCVILLRPTQSRSLYAQMVGRGTRIAPGKEDLLLLDFLWITRKHSLVKPAALIAHDENEAAAIDSCLGQAQGDLVGALEISRERALARQIAAQRKKRGEVRDLLDVIDICVAYQAPELEHYAPTMSWHLRAPTAKQVEFLRRHRVKPEAVRNRGQASAIINSIIAFNERVPASVKQIAYLRYLGWRDQAKGQLSKPAASRLIASLLATRAQKEVAPAGL